MNKNQKMVVCILASIIVIICCGLLYFYQAIIQQKKTNLIEEERVSQLTDSIYNNFESTDLKMVDLKGFVHSLEFREIAKFNGYDRSTLNLSMIFDKKGNIVDIKACYKNAENLYTATFERNENGQIKNITVRTSYTTGGGDSYKGQLIYHLQYNGKGHVSGISIEDLSEGGRGGEMSDAEIKFHDYTKGKGFMKRTMGYDDGIAIHQETILYDDVKNDMYGNWISRRGNLTNKKNCFDDYLTDEYESPKQMEESAIMQETRTITYYKKEEIDFSPYLK